MREDETELPEERVRRALRGLDPASAPEVPAAVTARISAALRSASQPPAHTATPLRSRTIAVAVGICVVAVAAAIGLAILLRHAPASRFPSGPTAETMTVPAAPSDTPKPVVTPP